MFPYNVQLHTKKQMYHQEHSTPFSVKRPAIRTYGGTRNGRQGTSPLCIMMRYGMVLLLGVGSGFILDHSTAVRLHCRDGTLETNARIGWFESFEFSARAGFVGSGHTGGGQTGVGHWRRFLSGQRQS